MTQVAKSRTKSKQQLLLLAMAFIIPIALAKLALTIGFKGEVNTHGGQLLSVDTTYQQIVGHGVVDEVNKQWRVVYFSRRACDTHCMTGLYHIQQTYKALGRLQDRVSLDLLNTDQHHATNPQVNLAMTLFSHHVVSAIAMPNLDNQVVIVDPHGNLVMSYRFDGQEQQNLIKAHDMLLDIKQLLKLSRIG